MSRRDKARDKSPQKEGTQSSVSKRPAGDLPSSSTNGLEQLGALGGGDHRRRIYSVALFLGMVGIIAITYWASLSAAAQYMDDKAYLESPLIKHPSWASLHAIFSEVLTPSITGYYAPLSNVSLMIDYLDPTAANSLLPFHRTALLLHLCNASLLAVLLYRLFENWIAACLVGLLYGVHPLNADAVLWVAERKTLLSTCFALASLVFYLQYVRFIDHFDRRDWKRYGASLLMYACAVLSKPTAIPLVALIPILDYWPLGRLNRKTVLEKVPFLVVCGISAAVAVASQTKTSAFAGSMQLMRPLYVPLVTAYSIGLYSLKTIWPIHLAADYPFPQPLSWANPEVLVYVSCTVLLIVAILISARRTRAWVTGGLFFLVALSPTLGIVRYTTSIAANRSLYLPIVGLLIPVGWGLSRLWDGRRAGQKSFYSRVGMASGVMVVVIAASLATRSYESHWQSTMELLEYYLSQTPHEWKIHTRLANEWIHRGNYPAAIDEFTEAIRLSPGWTENYLNLGRALLTVGNGAGAKLALEQALQRAPNDWQAHMLMGMALERVADPQAALQQYLDAAGLAPTKALPHYSAANILVQQGKLGAAMAEYESCLRLEPKFWQAQKALDALRSKNPNETHMGQ